MSEQLKQDSKTYKPDCLDVMPNIDVVNCLDFLWTVKIGANLGYNNRLELDVFEILYLPSFKWLRLMKAIQI